MPLSKHIWLDQLKVEYRVNPLGIDREKPRFSWSMVSAEPGQYQTAYQLLVASDPARLTRDEADVWNSGHVASDKSTAVPYAGPALLPATRYYWRVIVWDQRNNPVDSGAGGYFETGLKSTDGVEGWDGAQWIAMEGKALNSPGAPMLRKSVRLNGNVTSARLYISALGTFKVHINGQALGVRDQDGNTEYELLSPGWSNYDATIHYMTYDVTSYLVNQEVAVMGAILGNGWYNSRISKGSAYYAEEGNELALMAKLLITMEDGSVQVLVTDTGSGWKTNDDGPYRENDIYDGEAYDATREMTGWDLPGFDDSGWNGVKEHDFTGRFPQVKVVSYKGTPARILDELDLHPQTVTVYEGIINEGSGRNGRGEIGIVEQRSLPSAGMFPMALRPAEHIVFDLGQNMVGIPRLTLKGKAGIRLSIRFGEMLNDDSEGADGPKGSVYFANLRKAKQTAFYTLSGKENGETYQPAMTFFGFRYVEITVVAGDSGIEILELTGKVASSFINQTGRIETSDPDINKLFSNVIWGHRGNYLWIPTDCPQRDERLGWTGDTQLFANTALYNGDCQLFLENYMDILVDSQRIYGPDQASFTSTAPGFKLSNFYSRFRTGKGPVGQSGWADVGIILPWTVWQMTGDTIMMEEHFDSMTAYMDWMIAQTGEQYKGPGSIGDWLGFQGTGNQLMSDVYYAYDAVLMAQMAKALHKKEDAVKYKALYLNIKEAFLKRYIVSGENGRVTVKSSIIEDPDDEFEDGIAVYRSVKEDDTQTALLWCLKLRLYTDEGQRKQLIRLLEDNIRNTPEFKAAHPDSTRVHYPENTLSIGFLGVNIIAPVLTDMGLSELAYSLLLQDQMPSWLYSVKNGATTIWERWNSYSAEHGFGNVGMNSFNHYSYGAIAEWMYKYMAGISPDPELPGFKHILFKPVPDPLKRITTVKGAYESLYGTISCGWELDADVFTCRISVPANTSATVYMPARSEKDSQSEDRMKPEEFGEGRAVYKVKSGSYTFVSKI
ncbi:MAG: alpha-L-rhamnosidase [Paenibacillaceae bacterium]|nr:alpha-L-rhamnosidase [Paenibacillaceae bacterium]